MQVFVCLYSYVFLSLWKGVYVSVSKCVYNAFWTKKVHFKGVLLHFFNTFFKNFLFGSYVIHSNPFQPSPPHPPPPTLCASMNVGQDKKVFLETR